MPMRTRSRDRPYRLLGERGVAGDPTRVSSPACLVRPGSRSQLLDDVGRRPALWLAVEHEQDPRPAGR